MASFRVLLYILIQFFLPPLTAYAQSNFIVHHYTSENGLPANGVKGIVVDTSTGFAWIGTQSGLVRFDGHQFKYFSSAKNATATFRISMINKDKQGKVYCVDENYSLYRVNNEKPVFIKNDTLLIDVPIKSGNWNSINDIKEVVVKLKRYRDSLATPVSAVYGQNGDMAFSVIYKWQEAYSYYYDNATDSVMSLNKPYRIAKLDGSIIFIDDKEGLWKWNKALGKVEALKISGMPVLKGKGGSKKFVWSPNMRAPLLLCEGNIFQLQNSGDVYSLSQLCVKCYPIDAGISSADVWEKQHIIFLGGEAHGLYMIKAPFIRSVRKDTLSEQGSVECSQAELIPGLVTTPSGLLFSSNGNLLNQKPLIQFPSYGAYRAKDGRFWYSQHDTIHCFHPRKGANTIIPLHDVIGNMVFAETNGRLFAISDKAIGEIKDYQYRLLYRLLPTTASSWKNIPIAATEWKPGTIAFATDKIILFDTEKAFGTDTIAIPGLTAKVRSIKKYGDYFLIGTYGQGFYMYKDGIVKKMPLDKNQYLSYAHYFMIDDKGYCWISTNHGLFKVSMQALVDAYKNGLAELYYHYFGKNDGIVNTEFNGGCEPCALQLSNGSFSFPTMNGMALLDPDRPHTPPPTGKIFIEEVLADSISYQSIGHSLPDLPYDIKNLRFKISLPEFGNAENIYFSYKLEPYNNVWETQDVYQNNTIQFGGLRPGNYTLYLRVRNGFGANDFAVTEIRFVILNPWYRSWWFYLLCVVGLAALIFLLVRWRTATINNRKKELQKMVQVQTEHIALKSVQLGDQLEQLQTQQQRLEEDNRIKARLIGIISHDMISPIKFMGFMSKKLKESFSETDPLYDTAGSVVAVLEDLEALTGNMLNWIRSHHETDRMKPEEFNLHQLVQESIEIASTLAKEKGLNIYNEVSADIKVWQYKSAMGVILYNLVMNAVKYTTNGEVRITSQKASDHFTIEITDTGNGMKAELVGLLNSNNSVIGYEPTGAKKFQFGYRIIKDLLPVMKGSMKVESVSAKGTKVILYYPEIIATD